MQLSPQNLDPKTWSGGVLVLGRVAGAAPSALELALDEVLGKALSTAAERLLFKGKPRQVLAVDTHGRLPAARVLLIGLGDAAPSAAALRDLGSIAVNDALAQRHRSVGFVLPTGDAAAQAFQIAAGAQLGAYRWDTYKTKDPDAPAPQLERFDLLTDADVSGAVEKAGALAQAVSLSRTLVNEPPNECNPSRLAALAQALGAEYGFQVTILEREALEKRSMGGILAVGRGSVESPRLIHLAYTPAGAGASKAPLVFVGKGLTFDSGGLSIKPAKSMEDMYIDMAGAAAVLGLMRAVGQLKPNVPVHAIVGAAENMPDGAAYRPSDILRMANGKTVEVLNTDAEGRLVLADCLHYGTELKPAALVDLATLTGACMVGLGPNYSGLFTAHDDLAADLQRAAEAAGELIWRLPLDKKLGDSIKSQRGDIKNLGGPYGGAITGALFLQHFVGDTRWAHLDIAGPALADKDDGHIRAGGTGHGVLTLWSLVEAASA
jgi:leucyl aminopeptidase